MKCQECSKEIYTDEDILSYEDTKVCNKCYTDYIEAKYPKHPDQK